MRVITTIFYLLVIILAISFAILNAGSVEINLYFIKFSLPISILIVSTLGFGILLGVLLSTFRYWRLKLKYRQAKNQLNVALDNENKLSQQG